MIRLTETAYAPEVINYVNIFPRVNSLGCNALKMFISPIHDYGQLPVP